MPQCNIGLKNNHQAADEADSVLGIAGVLKNCCGACKF